MKYKQNNTAWLKTRKLFNDLHLWMGLASGIIIFVVCLSGTIYTYNTEIREWAAPHLHHVQPQQEKRSIDELISSIKQNHEGKITAVSIPNSPSRSYNVTVKPPNDNSRFGVTYYINQYTGKVLGTSEIKTKTDEFMGYLFSLHRWLLLDKIEKPIFGELENRKLGSYINGVATILFTLGLLTGLVIWFPRKIKNWRQGLKVKFSSNWKRINHDLHNSLALYAFIFLFLMGITGPQWSFDWYRTGLRKTLGTYEAPADGPKEGKIAKGTNAQGNKAAKGEGKGGRDSKGIENQGNKTETGNTVEFLAIEKYLEAASNTLNYPGDYRLSFPKSENDPIQISKYRTGFFAPSAGDQVSLNIVDASVSKVEIFKDKPFNERVSASIKALHIGNIYGQFSKLIYFIACLIATSLPVTGTLIWINKMKKTKKKPSSSRRTLIKKSKLVD